MELAKHIRFWNAVAPILWGQWVFCHVRAELEQAEQLSEEMRHLGEAQNDTMWKCFASAYSGDSCWFLGKFIEARAYFENALSLWDARYRAFAPAPGDPYVVTLIYLSRTLLSLGYVDQARQRRNEALAAARRHSPYSLAFALAQTWVADWAIEGAQSAARVLAWADEVLAISGEQGYPLWMGMGEVMRGWSLGALGQEAEGVPLIRKGIATIRSTGCNLTLPFHLTIGAETFQKYGQPVEASHWLADATKLVETTQERCVEAEMDRLRGTLLLSMAEHPAAEESFQRALAVARRQAAKTFELRAATSLARLWRDQGKRTEARDVLAATCNWFTEGYDTPVLQSAKALLDELT